VENWKNGVLAKKKTRFGLRCFTNIVNKRGGGQNTWERRGGEYGPVTLRRYRTQLTGGERKKAKSRPAAPGGPGIRGEVPNWYKPGGGGPAGINGRENGLPRHQKKRKNLGVEIPGGGSGGAPRIGEPKEGRGRGGSAQREERKNGKANRGFSTRSQGTGHTEHNRLERNQTMEQRRTKNAALEMGERPLKTRKWQGPKVTCGKNRRLVEEATDLKSNSNGNGIPDVKNPIDTQRVFRQKGGQGERRTKLRKDRWGRVSWGGKINRCTGPVGPITRKGCH